MAITVEIPTPMREQAGGNATVTVNGATVRAVLDDLVAQHPALGPKLFLDAKLRPYINVFIDNEDIRYLEDMDTPLSATAVVSLIPAVAGG